MDDRKKLNFIDFFNNIFIRIAYMFYFIVLLLLLFEESFTSTGFNLSGSLIVLCVFPCFTFIQYMITHYTNARLTLIITTITKFIVILAMMILLMMFRNIHVYYPYRSILYILAHMMVLVNFVIEMLLIFKKTTRIQI